VGWIGGRRNRGDSLNNPTGQAALNYLAGFRLSGMPTNVLGAW